MQRVNSSFDRFNKTTMLIVVCVLFCLAIGGAALVHRESIADQMNEWKLLPRKENVTELYFSEHTALPFSYIPGGKEQVLFTVRNLEYEPKIYAYEIVQQDSAGKNVEILTSGKFKLEHNRSQTESANFTYVDAGPRSRIVLRLIHEDQVIHYWVNKEPS